jgi:hypothetical protein
VNVRKDTTHIANSLEEGEMLWHERLGHLNVNVCKDTTHIANSLEEGAMLWHERLGHLNMASLKELYAMMNGMNLKEVSLHHICEGCVKGKHQRTSFPKDGATRA